MTQLIYNFTPAYENCSLFDYKCLGIELRLLDRFLQELLFWYAVFPITQNRLVLSGNMTVDNLNMTDSLRFESATAQSTPENPRAKTESLFCKKIQTRINTFHFVRLDRKKTRTRFVHSLYLFLHNFFVDFYTSAYAD